MNRRQLLSSSLAAGAALPLVEKAEARVSQGKSVLIIGAGISGLSAAHELQRNGFEVTVLEGRNRTGGRIFTSRAWPDIPLDLGASWIHGTRGNPLTKLADQIGASRIATDSDTWPVYGTDGELEKKMDQTWSVVNRESRRALRTARQGKQDISVLEAVSNHVDLEAMTEPERLRFLFVLNGLIELEYASDIEVTSSFFLEEGKEFSGEEVIFPGGYDAIVDHLAKDLSIHLNQKVTRVSTGSHGVTISTDTKEWQADYVVVTLPIGVLKHGDVTFDPPLPASKLKAVDQIGNGLLNKVAIRFSDCFWEKDADWIGSISQNKGHFNEWLSMQRVFEQPVLIAFLGASYARQLEEKSDDETIAEAMQVLRRNYGEEIPDPVDFQITRWNSDPFSRGAYSSPTLGITRQSREILATPVQDRLFFAGEATSEYPSTVHGALLAGQRAAREIKSAAETPGI